MLTMKDIIKEGSPILKKKSVPVEWPISNEDKQTLRDMLAFVINSQNDEMAKKYELRPAVGLAAPQIGINKRMFALVCNDIGSEELVILPIMNPEILTKSKKMTYLPGGEGCLSVDRETTGITPRHKELMIKGMVLDPRTNEIKTIKTKLTGFPAIAFQHEFDHLEGVLFVDKMYEKIENAEPLFEVEEE